MRMRFLSDAARAALTIGLAAAGYAAGGAVCSAQDSDGGQIFFFEYRDANEFPSFRAKRLTERMIRIVDWAIPERRGRYDITVEVSRDSAPDTPPAARLNRRKRDLKITLPANFADRAAHDPAMLRRLTAWMVLARLERAPDRADDLRGHWVVYALAHKAQQETFRPRMPFSREFPLIYPLAAHGFLPSPESAAATVPDGLFPALAKLHGEYAELLLDCCWSAGMVKNGLIGNLLLEALAVEPRDPGEAFADHAVNALPHPPEELKNLPPEQQSEWLDSWFRANAERLLLTFAAPMSPELFEERCLRAIRWEYGEGDARQSLTPRDLPARWTELEHPGEVVTALIRRLTVLGLTAPPLLREPLSELRLKLAKCRTEPTPETAAELQAAERTLFGALERQYAVERGLAEAQERLVRPAARLEYTLNVEKQTAGTPLSEVDKLLDKWDEYR